MVENQLEEVKPKIEMLVHGPKKSALKKCESDSRVIKKVRFVNLPEVESSDNSVNEFEIKKNG